MAFKKIRYNTGDNIVEIKIKDETGKFIENWTLMMPDLPTWFDIMRKKYGIKLEIRQRDLEWIR